MISLTNYLYEEPLEASSAPARHSAPPPPPLAPPPVRVRTAPPPPAPPDTLDAPHHRTEEAAVEAARLVLHGMMDHGIVPEIDIAPDEMPDEETRQACAAIRAAVEAGKLGLFEILPHVIAHNDKARAAVVTCTEGGAFAHSLEDLAPLADVIREHHRTRRKWQLGQRIATATANGQPIAALLAELMELESGGGRSSLIERAYAMAFDPDQAPPPDESCLFLGDAPIGAGGNLTGLGGKVKVGKGVVTSAILGAAQRGENPASGDTLQIKWRGPATGAIIHLDTEQSRADWHALVTRSVTRAGLSKVSPRLVSLPLVLFARSERLDILRQAMRRERDKQGRVDLVIIDGVADLCASPNDEAESLELVSRLHALAQEFDCAIVCILHENPGTEIGKTRGHLGSELSRKAFANLRLEKDAEGVTTIFGDAMRKKDIPRDQGFCFAWDDAAGMHTYRGRAAGLKAAQFAARAAEKAREMFAPIFEAVALQRENSAVPALTSREAAEIEQEITGNEKMTKPDTMRKRMQKAEILGVLRKFDALTWTITPAGTAGTQRENGNSSRT